MPARTGIVPFPSRHPDAGTAKVSSSPSRRRIIRQLGIELSIFHTFDADLDVTLIHVPAARAWSCLPMLVQRDGFIIQLRDGFMTLARGRLPTDQVVSGVFNRKGPPVSRLHGLDASGSAG